MYRPRASVRAVKTCFARVNCRLTAAAGFVHGTPAWQTGVVGPIVTVPCSTAAAASVASVIHPRYRATGRLTGDL